MKMIEIKNLGKRYKIAKSKERYIALRDILTNFIKHPIKSFKELRTPMEDFWALKNINLDVEKGDAIGIIGPNGAGKSTLLKVITQITPPTEGGIDLNGRVASLLEVGTGFHPELTGRENIYLNGAILGMTKKEINNKIEEIIEFAEIDKFIDTPVKRYSSGMYVRLAFSVAAHMEPDILLVDEVLAVGDANFQKKCIGKMSEVTQNSGRTIFLVSHNMDSISKLCNKCILLKEGKMVKYGSTEEVIKTYLESGREMQAVNEYIPDKNKEAQITKISILNNKNIPATQIPLNEDFSFEVEYEVYKETPSALICIHIHQNNDLILLSSETDNKPRLLNYSPGKYRLTINVPNHLLNIGNFSADFSIQRPFIEQIDRKTNIEFEIQNNNNSRLSLFNNLVLGKIATILDYKTEELN